MEVCLAQHDLLNKYLSYTTRTYLPKDGRAYKDGPSYVKYQSRQDLLDMATGQSDLGNSLTEVALLPRDSELCHIDNLN